MEKYIIAKCRVIFPNILLIIILIVSQSISLVQVTSGAEPTNSVYISHTLSKFTHIDSSIAYPSAPKNSIFSIVHDNISSAYEISLQIFLNKEFTDDFIRHTLVTNNISKACEVSLEIFSNKKIKVKTEGSSDQEITFVERRDRKFVTEGSPERNMSEALCNTSKIIDNYTWSDQYG